MSNTFQESIRKFGLRRKEQLNEAKQYEEDAFYYDMLRKNLDQEAAFFSNDRRISQRFHCSNERESTKTAN